MHQENRRSFVKKSLATSMTFTFSGLIRAHGDEGGTTTTWSPDGTTFETTSESTPYNPDGTTDGTATTIWNPDESTFESTPSPEDTTTWDPEETTAPEYDIDLARAYCSGSKTDQSNKPPGATWDSNYSESAFYSLSLPAPFVTDGCIIKYKLKVWINPSETPHALNASIEYMGEAFGSFYKNGQHGVHPITVITDLRKFDGSCSASTGHITPTDSAIQPAPSRNQQEYTNAALETYRIQIELVNPTISPSAGGAVVYLNANLKATLQRRNDDVPTGWEEVGVNPSKDITLQLSSHIHP